MGFSRGRAAGRLAPHEGPGHGRLVADRVAHPPAGSRRRAARQWAPELAADIRLRHAPAVLLERGRHRFDQAVLAMVHGERRDGRVEPRDGRWCIAEGARAAGAGGL